MSARLLRYSAVAPDVDVRHFRMAQDPNWFPHPVYTHEQAEAVAFTHREPHDKRDKLAYQVMRTARRVFDFVTGYDPNSMAEKAWLQRALFLETIAGVPGFCAAMLRHLHSLRRMQRDRGWIHTLLEEAENERMHLLVFLELQKPSALYRAMVLGAQGVFANMFFLSYVMSPTTCHRFVGYLEEEAVLTYTKMIKALDDGKLPEWQSTPASELSKRYWNLPSDAMMRDVLLAIRADEMVHREVNHALADTPIDQPNPFAAHAHQKAARQQAEDLAAAKFEAGDAKPVVAAQQA